ncbi:hypothetical protein H8E88_18845 [candidate division KSB1 bacterium]|nr:hypothetical protein [candidate division KSB1 bacterium]MBL7093326.1 hypothetical protein [candidate division KSB1 bacterium]
MLRHRRRTAQDKKNNVIEWENFSNLNEKIESKQHQKELKLEIQHLQLEKKLNYQIRRYIDKRLNQLNDQAKPEE